MHAFTNDNIMLVGALPPASCTMGTGSFPGVKSGRGVTLAPHPLLVPWSRKSRAIPLLPLWALRPVQSLSACTRVHFTFTLRALPGWSLSPSLTNHQRTWQLLDKNSPWICLVLQLKREFTEICFGAAQFEGHTIAKGRLALQPIAGTDRTRNWL